MLVKKEDHQMQIYDQATNANLLHTNQLFTKNVYDFTVHQQFKIHGYKNHAEITKFSNYVMLSFHKCQWVCYTYNIN